MKKGGRGYKMNDSNPAFQSRMEVETEPERQEIIEIEKKPTSTSYTGHSE